MAQKYSHIQGIRKAGVVPVLGTLLAAGVKALVPDVNELPGVNDATLVTGCIAAINYLKNLAKKKFGLNLPF